MNKCAGAVPSAAPSAGSTIINPSAIGVISTLAGTARFCMPSRRVATAPSTGPRVVELPWAEASRRFTALLEALAISWLQEASQQGVAELLALSWDEIHGILERAVQRGLARRRAEPIAHLGVDEKSFRKRHRYLTVVNDLNRWRVLFVAAGRRKASLDGFWETLSEEQLAGVEAVAMDIWDPTSPRRASISPNRTRRSFTTSFTSRRIYRRPWIKCGGRRTNARGRPATSV